MKSHKFNEKIRKSWPKTKQELEKGAQNVRTAILKGEKQLRSFSEKSIASFKKAWPETRQDLEKGLGSVRKAIQEGEKQIRILSEKGAKGSKKLTLQLKREKIYHDLGKAIASTPAGQWSQDPAVDSLLKQITEINLSIRKLSGS